MALLIWLPLNGNVNNQGLDSSYITPDVNYAAWASDGKIGGKSLYPTTTTSGVLSYSKSLNNEHSYTICAWVKNTDNTTTSSRYIVWTGSDSNSLGLGIRAITSGTVAQCVVFGASIEVTIGTNEWHHVCMVINHDALKFKVYLDGSFVSEKAYTVKTFSTNTFAVGWLRPSYYPFKGYINDVRVYDTCLSPKEVKEISKGLILHYKLDGNDIGITIPRNGGLIPDGVELYDYILSSGTQYIDTGYLINSSNLANIKMYADFTATTTYVGNRWWSNGLGGSGSGLVVYVGIGGGSTSNTPPFTYGNGTQDVNTGVNGSLGTRYIYILDLKNKTYKITDVSNNVLVNLSNFTVNTPSQSQSPTLFAWKRGNTGAIGSYFSEIFYNYKLYDNNQLVRNFIPCTYLGEPGMWDTVENKFYRNQGTGLFTLGNKITLKEYEYLESSKTQWIDTNFYPNLDSGSELKVQILPSSEAHSKLLYTDYTSTNEGSILWGWDINNSYRFRAAYYKSLISINAKINNNDVYLLKIDKNIYSINGITVLTNSTINFLSSSTVKLFARKNLNGSITNQAAMRLYYCKLYDDNQLVRDFIPVSYNGTPGLWDKVEWKFYANAGSGSFTLGPEKTVQQDVPIFYDSSGYCNHGSITGTLTTNSDSPRYTNSTLCSTSTFATITKLNLSLPDGPITLSFWSKPKVASTVDDSKIEITFGKFHYWTYINYPYFSHDPSTIYIYVNYWSDNKWHFVTCTYDGTTSKLYIDGNLTSPRLGGDSVTYQDNLLLEFRKNTLSDFRIYCTALSDDDIKELYNTSAFITNNGVFAEYELYESNLSDVKKRGLLETANFYENGAESGYALDTDKTRVASNYIISEDFIEI